MLSLVKNIWLRKYLRSLQAGWISNIIGIYAYEHLIDNFLRLLEMGFVILFHLLITSARRSLWKVGGCGGRWVNFLLFLIDKWSANYLIGWQNIKV